jgi:hypothetical protein
MPDPSSLGVEPRNIYHGECWTQKRKSLKMGVGSLVEFNMGTKNHKNQQKKYYENDVHNNITHIYMCEGI